jgi:hypothetical protein
MATLMERMWFTCRHQFSWPRRGEDGGYYQVCLLCGVRYSYDWAKMRRMQRLGESTALVESGKASPSTATAAVTARRTGRKCGVKPAWHPRERRLRFTAPVLYRESRQPEWRHAVAENISRSGLLFCADQPVTAGTALEMIFSMPAEICGSRDSNVLCRGVVARVQPHKPHCLIGVAISEYEFLPKGKVAGL